MNSNQKAILKAAFIMPFILPYAYLKMAWLKLFPKKGSVVDDGNEE